IVRILYIQGRHTECSAGQQLALFFQTAGYDFFFTEYVSNCVTPTSAPGICIGIRVCPPLLNLIQAQPFDPAAADFLRKSVCGFEGRDPRVCCPKQNPQLNIPARDDFLFPINPRPTESIEEPTAADNNDANLQYDLSSNPLLPTDCGKDLSQRILGGEKTDLDEFPWMTLLEYAIPSGKTTGCGGVLISHRYVVTAAHCIKSGLQKTLRLESVRLGEYNTATDPDCIPDGENEEICANNSISVGIAEQIAHERYQPTTRDHKYDVALLRLSRDVPFTHYIKAICLPSSAKLAQSVFVAGWGRTENRSSSDVKLKLSLSIADKEQCQTTYRTSGVSLGYGQICAGGETGKDSCTGDSGGPLMSRERVRDGTGRWSVVGVVSFGPSPCGKHGWPGVYTRIIDFVPWIVSKMRP
ncbi:CLIP domain-containing serine protease HP8-like, partial [Andrena cerasifolii]|uniref:CLIP domain-containing serine protease HP8-like n=1 Tax=Andrena cerasifolii TaxID=2819439 RepID=UPI004037B35A